MGQTANDKDWHVEWLISLHGIFYARGCLSKQGFLVTEIGLATISYPKSAEVHLRSVHNSLAVCSAKSS